MSGPTGGFDFNQNWYEIWMNQSKAFLASAEANLSQLFNGKSPVDPLEHMQQIQAWLSALQSQWNVMNVGKTPDNFHSYWQQMGALSQQATDEMMKEWVKRTKSNQPITNIQELYQLWLDCCHEVYAKAIRSADYQKMYGEFMNAALKLWKPQG